MTEAKLVGKEQLDLHGQLTIFSPGYFPEYDPEASTEYLKQGFRRSLHLVTVYLRYDHQEGELSVFDGAPPAGISGLRAFAIPIALDGELLQFDSEPEDFYGELGVPLASGHYLLTVFVSDMEDIGEYQTPKAEIKVFITPCLPDEPGKVLIGDDYINVGNEFVEIQPENYCEMTEDSGTRYNHDL